MNAEFDISFIRYNPKLGKVLGRRGAMFVNALQFLLNNQSMGRQQDGKKWIYNTIDSAFN